MVANQEVHQRTRGFARVLGPFYVIGATPLWQFVYLLGALMGIYLTYVGWATRPAPASQAPAGIQGLPRAA